MRTPYRSGINNNQGIILPYSLMIIMLISVIAMSLWFLTYYSEKENDNFQNEMIAANMIESAAVRIKYKVSTDPGNPKIVMEEIFTSENYGYPVKYMATITKPRNALPYVRNVALEIFIAQHKSWLTIKKTRITGNFAVSQSPYQFQYAICAGDLEPTTGENSSLHIFSGKTVIKPFDNMPLDEPNWVAFDNKYTTTMAGGVHLSRLDFETLGSLIHVTGNLVLEGEIITINGQGSIIVEGQTLINGNLDCRARNKSNALAIISKDNIILGPTANTTHAMLYSAGNIIFTGIGNYNILGSLTAAGKLSYNPESNINVWYDERYYSPVSLYDEKDPTGNIFLPVPFLYKETSN